MESFAIFKNDKFFKIMNISEITDLYYENETFKKGVDNKEIIIYMRDDKAVLSMMNFQNKLDELGKKIKKYYKYT